MVETLREGAVQVRAESRIVRATLNRPEHRNAISGEVVDGLAAAVRHAEEREAHVLVLRGTGGHFCAGADLNHVDRLTEDREGLSQFVSGLSEVLDRLEDGPFVSVVGAEGFVLAGGCEILLACDVSVASTSARIGDRHMEYGLAPGAGGSIRLARSLPTARSRYLLLSGEFITGEDAASWGLVTAAVPEEEFESELESMVARFASRSREAIATIKAMLVAARSPDQHGAMVQERELFLDHLGGTDARDGLAAFQNDRRPRFEQWETMT